MLMCLTDVLVCLLEVLVFLVGVLVWFRDVPYICIGVV
jgi:hypothetical protein